MAEPVWLERVVLDAIHLDQLREHGGLHGIRDENTLESALARARNKWAYDGVHDLPTLAGFWVGADIAARRAANIIDDEAQGGQLAQRAIEKQKMLDVLVRLELVRADLPREAAAYPELTGELHNAIVGFLAMTPSQLLAINQEDLTKEVHQQNLPGSTWQYPNWGRKMRFTIEQLRGDSRTRGYTTMFHDWIERSGRRNQRE